MRAYSDSGCHISNSWTEKENIFHVVYKARLKGTFIGLPDFAKSDFLDSKRPELSKMDQNDRFEPRKSDLAKSGKPMNLNCMQRRVCACIYCMYACMHLCMYVCIRVLLFMYALRYVLRAYLEGLCESSEFLAQFHNTWSVWRATLGFSSTCFCCGWTKKSQLQYQAYCWQLNVACIP